MKRRKIFSPVIVYVITLTFNVTALADSGVFKSGHLKYRFLRNTFPDDSLFLNFTESPSIDHSSDLRLNLGWKKSAVQVVVDYQLIAVQGDSISFSQSLPGVFSASNSVSDDDLRAIDLTHVLSEDNDSVLAHRLDRMYVDITTTNTVVRIGRQAVSWGNGLIYSAMDFFNPFDPASVDNEYKVGDDIFYGQYLRENGDDLQAVWVIRRDINGEISNEVDSIATKYHGFIGDSEYDLLLAEHYNDTVFGIGGIVNLGGAVWRGDITLTDTETKNVTSLVTSLSYSWVSWNHNVSGILEYFYNGFGQANGDYSPAVLITNSSLAERFIRGELFTLGQQYIAASALIEMAPLWTLTPNVFVNTSDHSYLIQLVSAHDLKQNWQLQAALSIPIGDSGTEFGGIDSGVAGQSLSTDLSLYMQLGWYF